jgi:hypothetical protein
MPKIPVKEATFQLNLSTKMVHLVRTSRKMGKSFSVELVFINKALTTVPSPFT